MEITIRKGVSMIIPDDLSGIKGEYYLVEKIGQGGNGVVLKGENKADGSEVAIKILLSGNPSRKSRFQREIEILLPRT